jgi:hypothetical protein
MKLPQTALELKNEILISSDKTEELGDLRIRQLIKILDKVPDDIIVEGILEVFKISDRPQKMYTDQKYAGRILAELTPQFKGELIDILISVMGNWNKSVEEFPFWIRDNFGVKKKCFRSLRSLKIPE